MLSVAASREGRRVTKTTQKTPDSPVEGVGFERSGLSPAFLGLLDESIPLVIEGAGDPEEPWDRVEQSSDFAWEEEKPKAVRQGRKAVERTLPADSLRVYLTQIGKVALLPVCRATRVPQEGVSDGQPGSPVTTAGLRPSRSPLACPRPLDTRPAPARVTLSYATDPTASHATNG